MRVCVFIYIYTLLLHYYYYYYYVEQTNVENNDKNKSNHENMIEIETVFVCEICSRDFNDRASLWLHIRAAHKEYAAFACGVCLKICADNTQLQNHVNMYHGGPKLLISEQRRLVHFLSRNFYKNECGT